MNKTIFSMKKLAIVFLATAFLLSSGTALAHGPSPGEVPKIEKKVSYESSNVATVAFAIDQVELTAPSVQTTDPADVQDLNVFVPFVSVDAAIRPGEVPRSWRSTDYKRLPKPPNFKVTGNIPIRSIEARKVQRE
jgi:hypothetical protein